DVRPTPALAPAALAPAALPAPAPAPAPASAAPTASAMAPTPIVMAPVPAAPAATEVPHDARAVLATLEVTSSGVMKGQTYEIHVPLAHVGRGSHNDIVIQDDSVSETHAKLQRRDDGWYVVDIGSTNGTYVGGQRLVAERRLDGAPDVRFGGVKTLFRAADVPLDVIADTRPIASVDRGQGRQPVPKPIVRPESASTPTEPAQAIATWVWIVVALAVLGAVALFARSR